REAPPGTRQPGYASPPNRGRPAGAGSGTQACRYLIVTDAGRTRRRCRHELLAVDITPLAMIGCVRWVIRESFIAQAFPGTPTAPATNQRCSTCHGSSPLPPVTSLTRVGDVGDVGNFPLLSLTGK